MRRHLSNFLDRGAIGAQTTKRTSPSRLKAKIISSTPHQTASTTATTLFEDGVVEATAREFPIPF
jgi:hypothetical protein